MKKLLIILGILLFLTDLNVFGGKVIRSNWDGYMSTDYFRPEGSPCISPQQGKIVIDIYFKLQSGVSLESLENWEVGCYVNIDLPVVPITMFTGPDANNEYTYPLHVNEDTLGSNIEYIFTILPPADYGPNLSTVFVGYGSGKMEPYEAGSKPCCVGPINSLGGLKSASKRRTTTNNSSTDITEKATEFSVFPNPFLDNMHIEYFAKENEDIEIKILDLNGRIVYMSKENNILAGNNQLNIDTWAIRKGIYFCHIRTKKQNHIVKLVKKE